MFLIDIINIGFINLVIIRNKGNRIDLYNFEK